MPPSTKGPDNGLRKKDEQNSRLHGKQAGYLTASMECSIERPMLYSQQLANRFEKQTERHGAAEGKSARRGLLAYRSGIPRYVCRQVRDEILF